MKGDEAWAGGASLGCDWAWGHCQSQAPDGSSPPEWHAESRSAVGIGGAGIGIETPAPGEAERRGSGAPAQKKCCGPP